jgi:hypothetical protein
LGVTGDGYGSAGMLFDHDVRAPAQWELEYAGEDNEPARIRAWQREQLMRIGYDRTTARRIVLDAWACGESGGLVHRVVDLIGLGASHDQAARIA